MHFPGNLRVLSNSTGKQSHCNEGCPGRALTAVHAASSFNFIPVLFLAIRGSWQHLPGR